jgi:UDP-N-acetyl-D-glucosamine dehydrogenase
MDAFEKQGCIVEYYDPYVKNHHYKGYVKESIDELNRKALSSADLVVITTSHTNIDYDFVQSNSKYIFDTKNAMNDIENRENIELL